VNGSERNSSRLGADVKGVLIASNYVVSLNNMKAKLIARERYTHKAGGFVEIVIWQVPQPVLPCTHYFKYRLVYILNGIRIVGYDNERGKGDHYHFGEYEHIYNFSSIAALLTDFDATVDRWNNDNGYRSP